MTRHRLETPSGSDETPLRQCTSRGSGWELRSGWRGQASQTVTVPLHSRNYSRCNRIPAQVRCASRVPTHLLFGREIRQSQNFAGRSNHFAAKGLGVRGWTPHRERDGPAVPVFFHPAVPVFFPLFIFETMPCDSAADRSRSVGTLGEGRRQSSQSTP
jgi:hypothetical protein